MTTTPSTTTRVIRCALQSHAFCFAMDDVASVQRTEVVDRSVDDHGTILGMLKLSRGTAPVFRLSTLLGLPGDDRALRSVVVVRGGGGLFGLAVEGVSRVSAVKPEQMFPAPSILVDRAAPLFDAIVRVDTTVVTGEHDISVELKTDLLPRLSPRALAVTAGLEAPDYSPANKPANQKSLRRAKTAATPRPGQLVLFSATSQTIHDTPCLFGLNMTQVFEIITPPATTPVPGAPSYVMGLALWRQQPVPIVNLAAALGLETEHFGRFERAIIVRADQTGETLALGMDAAIRNVRLPLAHAPVATPNQLPPDRIRGIYKIEDGILVIPHLTNLCA